MVVFSIARVSGGTVLPPGLWLEPWPSVRREEMMNPPRNRSATHPPALAAAGLFRPGCPGET
ncbi:MAG: hypothetical protein ACK6AD_09855 [Cyanobacteriota bacterium]